MTRKEINWTKVRLKLNSSLILRNFYSTKGLQSLEISRFCTLEICGLCTLEISRPYTIEISRN